MKKKILAILMATLTVGSLLSGCGGAQSGDANGNQESSKQESSDSEEPAEVVFAYMTQNNIPESSELERIQNLINDYTVDKINTKVKLVLFSNSDYMNQVNLMLASGEQIDLFQSLNTPHLKYMKDGTALDITAYLDDELKETKEIVYDKFLEPTTIEGKTYGIMNMGSAYLPRCRKLILVWSSLIQTELTQCLVRILDQESDLMVLATATQVMCLVLHIRGMQL